MKIKFILFFCLLFSLSAYTQTNFWSDIAVNQMLLPAQTKTQSSAWNYRSLQLDMEGLNAALRNAPMQYTIQARQNPMTLLLPMPNDKMEAFTLVESPVMEPELAAKYPFIKTYKGQGVNNRAASVRLGITQKGFHATILSPQGTVYIDPYAENQDAYYISYFVKDNINP